MEHIGIFVLKDHIVPLEQNLIVGNKKFRLKKNNFTNQIKHKNLQFIPMEHIVP